MMKEDFSRPFKFIILTNSGEENPIVCDILRAGLRPELICSESPFHFKSSYFLKHIIKLLVRYVQYILHRQPFEQKYQAYFLSRKHNIPFFPSYKVNTEAFIDAVKKLDIDFGFVFTFRVLQKSILKSTKCGFVNFHPALLPEHRGATPHQWAIFLGDTTTGITFHMMDEGIDTGPVIEQHVIPLSGKETAQGLYENLLSIGSDLMVKLIYKMKLFPIEPLSSQKLVNPLEPPFDPKSIILEDAMSWQEMDRWIRASRTKNKYAGFTFLEKKYDIIQAIQLENPNMESLRYPRIDRYQNIITRLKDGKLVYLITKT